jgi:hypothetical protein
MFFFVSEPYRPGLGTEEEQKGFIARLRFRLHTAYESLRRRFDYEENVCATLRFASVLTLRHPGQIDCSRAQAQLRAFLDGRHGKHRRWIIVDTVLALFGALLTPLPGPNIFFIYPAVRALSHYFALRGINNAGSLPEIACCEDDTLSRIQQNVRSLDAVAREVKELEEQYNIHRLMSLLETL